MIVEMRRVLVFGPKRLLGAVIDEVQRTGALHIDRIEAEEASLKPLDLDEAAAAELNALQQARTRVDGLLGLLPPVASESRATAADLAEATASAIEAVIAPIETGVHELTRRRLAAEEELELIRTYEGAMRVLAPLLGAVSGSKSLEAVGFVLRGKDLTVVTSLHNQLRELTDGRVEVVSRIIQEGKIGVVAAFHRRDAEAVRGFLTRAGISELRLPARFTEHGPADALRLMEQRRAALPGALDGIARELAALSRRYRSRLLAIRGLIADRLGQLETVPSLAQSRYTFILHGWAPANRVSEVRGILQKRFGRDVVVHDLPADLHEAEQVPVMLDNPPVIKPFQRMLGLFKPPRYGNLDPTIFLAIFFPIFTGVVIGDVAYGALLFAFGWWMRNKALRGETWHIKLGPIDLGMRVAPPALADMSWIVRTIAVWTILFGVLYLEVFGNLLETRLGLDPFFNRVELTTAFFMLTLAFGIVQVTLGNVLHLVLALRHRHTVGVFESLALICGVVGILAVLGAMGQQLPQQFFTPGLALLAAFVVFFLIGFVMSPGGAWLWPIEMISGMGNVLSYARLFGVGLAAAVLANVSNELGGMLGPIWIGVFIGIVIQMIFFIFTLPGHVIQPARLNWVEFLTKFKYHDETGNSYRPLQKTGGD